MDYVFALTIGNVGLQHLMADLRSGSSLEILSLSDADSSKYQISCLTRRTYLVRRCSNGSSRSNSSNCFEAEDLALSGNDVHRLREAVVLLENVDSETLLAEGNAGDNGRLHGTAIVVFNFPDPFVLSMMRMPAKDNIGALFCGVPGGAFSNDINCPNVVFTVVL